MSAEKRTFKGSCSCGHIKYTVALDTSDLTACRCNCTFCQKFGFTGIQSNDKDWQIVSPASVEELPVYKHRRFCPTCAVMVMSSGSYEWEGKTYYHFSVNAGTLDQPQDGLDVSQIKVNYYDGLNDNWNAGLKDKPWPNGLI